MHKNKSTRSQYQHILLFGGLILIGAWFLFGKGDTAVEGEREQVKIEHGHGLAVDAENPDRLYIATHHGLYALEGGEASRLGKTKQDFMGFSAHPDDSMRFYSSGHPVGGGNLGVLESRDGGVTWDKIANGVGGPVDFHSMAISPANPEVLFGWYGRNIQRSTDGGKNWEKLNADIPDVSQFVPHPKNEDELYAVTLAGIRKSSDAGESWTESITALSRVDGITILAIDPEKTNRFYAFTRTKGFQWSEDEGATWQSVSEDFNGEFPLHIAIAKPDPSVMYVYTHKNSVYRSSDSGQTWELLLLRGEELE